MTKIKVGDKVTCRIAVEAYYSNYGGNPVQMFTPGMVGTVAAIAAKVRIIDRGDGTTDRRDRFVVVDYTDPVSGKVLRCGLNFCNCVRLSLADLVKLSADKIARINAKLEGNQ